MEVRFNHLKNEKSPYLQQHASNPVDWYPWGDEAFNRAKTLNKLVLVSVGYSTCHWCHVMERESFSRERIGTVLNDSFVCIKVDREERPDVDAFLIDFSIRTTGSAGWPLNVIMTQEKKPLLAFTYLPPESRGQNLGLFQLATGIAESWKNDPSELLNRTEETSGNITNFLKHEPEYSQYITSTAYAQLEKIYDTYYGGFSRGTKFPSPHNLMFLASYYHETGNNNALSMAEHTVGAMRMGGIYDHAGYGIHRYATDIGWKIPHFEKMLYDQASMILALSDLYLVTRKKEYYEIIREFFQFLRKNMKSDSGGYYTAMDADSEGIEGKYYTWTQKEIDEVLKNNSGKFSRVFNIMDTGNYSDEAKGESTGRNILYLDNEASSVDSFVRDGLFWLEPEIRKDLSLLEEARKYRIPPLTDTKVCSDLNGLLLYSMCSAYSATLDPDFLKASEELAEYLMKISSDGKLPHIRYNDGKTIDGFFSDYSFVSLGLTAYSALFPHNTCISRVKELMDDTAEKAAKDISENIAKGYGVFLGSWNSQEDSAMPSPFSAYERVQIYLRTLGIEITPSNVTPEEFEGNVARYPAYFTFRVQNQILKDHIFLIKKNGMSIDESANILKMLREKGVPDQILFTGMDASGEGYSLCTGNSCVMENTSIEQIMEYIVDKHVK